jgi:hypothetical protein
LKDLAQISLPVHGDYVLASPMPISEEQKNKCKKTFTCFLRLIAAPVAVTYNDKGEREKRESYGRY